MKILIFTEVLAPYVCGVSSYVQVLKQGLEKLSHNVVIVTSSLHKQDATLKNGIIYCPARRSGNKYGYECRNPSDSKTIDFIMDFKPDIVHIHTDTKIGYMGLLVADKTSSPVIFTIHDYFFDRFASDNSKMVWNVKTYFEKQHFRDMLDNAVIVTSSCSRASLFVQKADRKRKVRLIQSSTDTDKFDYRSATPESIRKIRTKLGLSPKSTVAVFAGQITVEKNLEFLITAFAKYIKRSEDIQLLIAGEGPEADYLKALCRTLKISDRVIFTGNIANSLMPDVYSACDIYVCSSDDGLMSMSFLEAMSCGLPVLVKSDKEQIVQNTIKNGVNGFVYTKKAEFAKYLKTLASLDTAKRKRIKQIVRNSIVTENDEKLAEQYVSVYESAIQKYKKKRYK